MTAAEAVQAYMVELRDRILGEGAARCVDDDLLEGRDEFAPVVGGELGVLLYLAPTLEIVERFAERTL